MSWRHKQKHDWLGCTLFNWVSWVQLSYIAINTSLMPVWFANVCLLLLFIVYFLACCSFCANKDVYKKRFAATHWCIQEGDGATVSVWPSDREFLDILCTVCVSFVSRLNRKGVFIATQLNSTQLNSTDPVEQRTAKSVVFLFMMSRPANWVNCCSRCRVEFSCVAINTPLKSVSRSF